MSSLSNTLLQLSNEAESLWNKYLELGPGKLPKDGFEPIGSLLGELRRRLSGLDEPRKGWSEDFESASNDLHLLRRCVERAEGLSFVTGEAGLIPRRDLHERCEAAIHSLRDLCHELGAADL